MELTNVKHVISIDTNAINCIDQSKMFTRIF